MPKKLDIQFKLNQPKIHVVTYLYGKTKKAFLEDIIDREEKETVILREIIDEHYRRKGKY